MGKISPDKVERAKQLRQTRSMSWADIGIILGVSGEGIRRRVGLEYNEKRKQQTNSYRRMRTKSDRYGGGLIGSGADEFERPHNRPTPEMMADRERRLSLPLTIHQLILGDPPPGRSALDQKQTRV